MSESRSFDGRDNNKDHPEWGQAGRRLRRMIPSAYADGISIPSGKGRGNSRNISNIVCIQCPNSAEHETLSNYMWAWGQYLDHQLDMSPGSKEPFIPELKTPANDCDLPNAEIPFTRSAFDRSTGTSKDNPR